MSSIGGPGAYQPFGLPAGGAPSRKAIGMSEKITEGDSDRSASLGFGMTEKEIDDRVRFPSCYFIRAYRGLPR